MMQATLDFSRPDMTAANARADVGVQRAAERADKASPDWTIKAADMLRIGACILHAKGVQKFTVEQVRELVADALPTPTDGRAWGAATRRAKAMGFLSVITGEFAPTASSNCSPKQLYGKGPQA